jgi:hypothetical protein
MVSMSISQLAKKLKDLSKNYWFWSNRQSCLRPTDDVQARKESFELAVDQREVTSKWMIFPGLWKGGLGLVLKSNTAMFVTWYCVKHNFWLGDKFCIGIFACLHWDKGSQTQSGQIHACPLGGQMSKSWSDPFLVWWRGCLFGQHRFSTGLWFLPIQIAQYCPKTLSFQGH